MSDAQAASSSASAAPAWFTALTAPASAAPVDPAPSTPDASGEPAPVESSSPAPTPDPDPPLQPEPQVQPAPDPEVEALRRQVAELQAAQVKREADERRQQLSAERTKARDEYFAEVRKHAATLDDLDERDAYWQQAVTDFDAQQEAHQDAERLEREAAEVTRAYPDHIGKEWNLTPDQIAEIAELGESQPDWRVAGIMMTGMAHAFRKENAKAPSPDTLREQATQALADKAAAEVAASGALATGGLSGTTPSGVQKPTALRPGSRESHDILAGIIARR